MATKHQCTQRLSTKALTQTENSQTSLSSFGALYSIASQTMQIMLHGVLIALEYIPAADKNKQQRKITKKNRKKKKTQRKQNN